MAETRTQSLRRQTQLSNHKNWPYSSSRTFCVVQAEICVLLELAVTTLRAAFFSVFTFPFQCCTSARRRGGCDDADRAGFSRREVFSTKLFVSSVI